MMSVPLSDETAVVDLQSADERQEDNQPLISLPSSASLKKWIAAAFVLLVCFSGIILLVVMLSKSSLPIPPIPTTTSRPGPVPIPTVRPLPKNSSNMTAESLLYLVFNASQLDYVEIKCIPQSPPTFKFMLQVENYDNFTGESNTKDHARVAVSREAAHVMFGVEYDDDVPPPPQSCQVM